MPVKQPSISSGSTSDYRFTSWPRNFTSMFAHCRPLFRTGRLVAHFPVKSVFGRPRRLATRASAAQFMATHYRRFSGQEGIKRALSS